MLYKYDCTPGNWKEFIAVMQSGQRFEIDEKMFYYWLEVLPPVFMNREIDYLPGHEVNVRKSNVCQVEIDYLPGHEGRRQRVDFGFAEGAEAITVFWRDLEKRRFYGQRTNKINEGI